MYPEIKSDINHHALTVIEDKFLDKAQRTVGISATFETKQTLISKTSATKPLILKLNAVGKTIHALFFAAFNEVQCQELGIVIDITSAGWFRRSIFSLNVNVADDILAKTDNHLLRMLQTLAKQYLKEKQQRRADTSFFAVPYKSFIADLIYRLINSIYQHNFSREKLIHYLETLDSWLSKIRQDRTLFDTSKSHAANDIHFESFLLEVQRAISAEVESLNLRTEAHVLHDWLTRWQDSLRIILRTSILWWHAAIHTQAIPENLYEQLEKLGAAYQRHLEQEFIDRSDQRFKMTSTRYKHWQTIQTATSSQLRLQPHDNINDTLLTQAVKTRIISWEQYYFFNLSEHYTASQLLWELLYYPAELPLSATAIKNELCYAKVLDLYRAKDEATRHLWFLLLQTDIQLAHCLTPRIIELNDHKDYLETSKLIAKLSSHIKQTAQIEWLINIPSSWHPGILTEIDQLVKIPCAQTTQAITLLITIKRCQAQLAHLVGTLELFRKILPESGEIIGALVLGQHLQSAVNLVKHCGSELQLAILQLNQLLRFGSKTEPGLQSIALQYKQSWFVRAKSNAISQWLSIEKERHQQGSQICDLMNNSIRLSGKLHRICEPAVLKQRIISTERLFLIADDLSEPFLTRQDEKKSTIAKKIMCDFTELVHSNLSTETICKIEEKKAKTSTLTVCEQPLSTPSVTVIPSVTQANVTSEAKTSAVLSQLNTCVNLTIKMLQSSTGNFDTLLNSWQSLLTSQQNNFFATFVTHYSQQNPQQWSSWFQKHVGLSFSPLPRPQAPTRWLWWYRHTILDRALFFRASCLSLLIERIKKDPGIITAAQHIELRQLLTHERAIAEQHYHSHSTWLDRWHCGLHAKFGQWRLCLQQHIAKVNTLPLTNETKAIPKLEVALLAPATPAVTHTVTTNKGIVVPSKQNMPDEKHSVPKLFQIKTPLELTPESPAWQEYRTQLTTAPNQRKELWCLTFLSATLAQIQQGHLSIAKSEHRQLFQAATLLFWQVIQNTTLANTTLGVLLESLQGHSFAKLSYQLQQSFFVIKASRLIESYKPIQISISHTLKETL